MNQFVFHTTPQIVSRPGAASNLGDIVGNRLGDKILFVTDSGIRRVGLETSALVSLEDAGHEIVIFDEVEADPCVNTLEAANDIALSNECTGVVALGGGSSMDIAKLVALLARSGEDIEKAWGVGNAKGPRLPLVLIPTTAGTGSEVTPVSIITTSSGEKRGVSSPVILPDIAILDATLTQSVPALTTAATGIDAMVHAIEAYTSKNANHNLFSSMLAEKALSLLGLNIKTAALEPDNIAARSNMLLGSCLAGMAFANSPVAAVHALAYPIGGNFNVPHGLSNALVLPHVLRFNAEDTSNGSLERYARLAPHAFPNFAKYDEKRVLCNNFIDELQNLSIQLGLQSRLREVGISQEDLPMMASEAMKQQRLLVNNPRTVSESDALHIYKKAW